MIDARGPSVPLIVLLLVATSGCIGFLSGQEPLAFEAEVATVGANALSETGYEETNRSELAVEETFEVAGQSREVRVTNQVVQYERSVGVAGVEQRAALFVVVSSPQVRVLDRTFNPIGEMSNRELLGRMQSSYSTISVGERRGSETVSALGTRATVDRFAGTARVAGTESDIFIHVTRIEHDGDFVVAIGAYPQLLPDEGDRVLTLVRNLRHAA